MPSNNAKLKISEVVMNQVNVDAVNAMDLSKTEDFETLLEIVRDCILDLRGYASENEKTMAYNNLITWLKKLKETKPKKDVRDFLKRKDALILQSEAILKKSDIEMTSCIGAK